MTGLLVTAEVEREIIETDSGTVIVETSLLGPEGPPGPAGEGGGEGGGWEEPLANEATERQEADAQEIADREEAIEALSSVMATDAELATEATTRGDADTALDGRIDDEVAARNQAIADAIDAVIDGAPGAFDTLKELAAAAESDASGIAALVTSVAGKASKGEVVTEKERAEVAEALRSTKTETAAAVNVEKGRAETAEALKASKTELGTETTNRESGDSTEKSRAETAEALKLAKASNLSDLANAGTARTNLGLGTAATQATGAFDASGAAAAAQAASQPLDSDLTAIAALSTTAFGRSLLEAANAAGMLTTLGTQSTTAADAKYAPHPANLVFPWAVNIGRVAESATVAPLENSIRAVRCYVPKAGTLTDLYVFIGTASGNVIAGVYDTGDALAGSRTSLYNTGSIACPEAGAWRLLGKPEITVKQGQAIDLGIVFNNATAKLAGESLTTTAVPQLPANFAPAAGGAFPKFAWSRASATWPETITEANCTTSGILPYLIARVA